MRGRPGCPTGQEKKHVEATVSNPLFYKERLVTGSPPHPPQCAHWGTFPPRGRLWGWEEPFPSEKPPPPARPAGGRAVTDVRYRAAGQAEKKREPTRVPPTRKGGSREEEPLPPWCSFLRLSSKESRAPARGRASRAPARGRAGQRGAAPRGTGKAPTTRRVRSTDGQAPGPTWRVCPPFSVIRGPFSPFPIDNLYSCGRV